MSPRDYEGWILREQGEHKSFHGPPPSETAGSSCLGQIENTSLEGQTPSEDLQEPSVMEDCLSCTSTFNGNTPLLKAGTPCPPVLHRPQWATRDKHSNPFHLRGSGQDKADGQEAPPRKLSLQGLASVHARISSNGKLHM